MDSPMDIMAGPLPFRDQKRFWRDPVKRTAAAFRAVKLGGAEFLNYVSLCEADNPEIDLG